MARDLHGLTVNELNPLVRRLLLDESAHVSVWTSEPLTEGFSGATLYRLSGQATTDTGLCAWSLVCKQVSSEIGSQQPDDRHYWKRELLFYESDLPATFPPDLIIPRCIGSAEVVEQGGWLWLEDMGVQAKEPWSIEEYGSAARHFGQLNGTYLVSQPLPEANWLCKPDVRRRLQLAEPGIEQLPLLSHNPHFGSLFPEDRVARIQHLWAERERLLTALEQLPLTFCHRDTVQFNLRIRHNDQNRAGTVALDWGACGLGRLGEELAPLFAISPRFVLVDTQRLADLDQTIFAGYIAGLRDVGWQGDEQLARLGFSGLCALNVAVADPAIRMPRLAQHIASLPAGAEPPKLLSPGGYEQLTAVDNYLLGLGDEALRLLDRL